MDSHIQTIANKHIDEIKMSVSPQVLYASQQNFNDVINDLRKEESLSFETKFSSTMVESFENPHNLLIIIEDSKTNKVTKTYRSQSFWIL